jgi:thiamine biosynthesis protein ThiI
MKKALLLLSGGIDSPVAGHLLKKKLNIDAVHFSIEPFTDDSPEKKSAKLAKLLGIKKLIVINTSKEFSEIVKECNHRIYFVLSKRLMLRIAEELAKKQGYDYLITGESIGQVSSQTLPNLSVIDKAVKIQVLRPLLGYDKNEIIKVANEIGSFESSKGPEVCDKLGPKHPSTNASLDIVLKEEENLDIKKMVKEAIKNARS